jgi:hypothetical protein
MARQNQNAGHPETFVGSEHTTEEVRRTAELLGAENASSARAARTTGRNVQKIARIQRGHQGSRAAAVSSQAPKRENIPVTFKPTSDLEAPPAPPGFVRRWIRFKVGDRQDPKNLTRKFRLGWRPYLVKDAPDFMPPETTGTAYGEAICSGDLMLCIIPATLQASRDAYYRRQNEKRSATIADKVREFGDDIEVSDKRSLTRGKRPRFQTDGE